MLENEIVIFLKWSMDNHTKHSEKFPICQFRLFIIKFFLNSKKYATKFGLCIAIPTSDDFPSYYLPI
jgi:hypothetical protein